ncbi:hypothetical protein HMPREF9946_01545 [Acetobacteraceae bacterium AT-5844]|nr:hypothetical protein HMPREF9946_01545 [Acetobacteraceae bacterium AT-5844]
MHLVAENTPEQIRERELLDRLRWALRELAANLMRITRGAGKPYDVVDQIASLITIVADYQKLTGRAVPMEAFSDALVIQRDWDGLAEISDGARERLRATEQVVEGALQVAASRLLGQTTHASRGTNEMFDGMHRIRDLNEKERIAREAAMRARQKPKVSTKRTRPVKPPSE